MFLSGPLLFAFSPLPLCQGHVPLPASALICLGPFLNFIIESTLFPSLTLSCFLKGCQGGPFEVPWLGSYAFQKHGQLCTSLTVAFLLIFSGPWISQLAFLWFSSSPVKYKSHIFFRSLTYFLLRLYWVFLNPSSDKITLPLDKKLLPHLHFSAHTPVVWQHVSSMAW